MVCKKKICKCGCGEEGYIWKNGMLKSCFYRLNPPKPIPKFTERGKAKMEQKQLKLAEIHAWEKALWDKMTPPRRCQSCNCIINGSFSPMYFDHLKEKSSFPELAMIEWNIFFCCSTCHNCKNNGFPTERHKQAILKAEEIYESKNW